MPALVIPNAAQLRTIWQLNGVDWAINVYGVGNAGAVAITQALTNTIGTAIKGYFTSSGMGAKVSAPVTLNRIGLRDISAASQPEFFDATTAAVAGTAAGDLLPLPNALCITLRTALAGKRYRGRSYLFGCSEGSNALGVADTPTRTAAVAFINGIGSALSSAGLQLAVLSHVGTSYQAVTSVQSRDSNWAVQRRRRSGI